MRRWQKIGVAIVGGIVVVAAIVIFVFTQTDFGRERVRMFALGQLTRNVHGIVRVGRVSGNLLSGATLEELVITDSAGRPFLRADTLSLRYSLRSLFQKHLVFRDVYLVRPIVVADQPPGGKWNFQRLFPADTLAGDSIRGFGDWVRFENVTVRDGTVTVRRSWTAPATHSGRAREAVIREALSADSRDWVVPVTGGYQAISMFYAINGRLPLVRFADPDSAARVVDVGSLRMIALPYRPPAASVQNMKGRVLVGADTVVFRNLEVTLPASQLRVDGTYTMSRGDLNIRVAAPKVALGDMRFIRPSLPDGGGRVDLAISREADRMRTVATGMDLRVEAARVRGSLDLETGAELRIGPSHVQFQDLDTRLIERLARIDMPVDGVLVGDVQLAGAPDELDVNGWSNIRDRRGEVSRIEANGVVSSRSGLIARDLRLEFNPLRLSLLRGVGPDLPVGGLVTGRATLNGDLNARFDVNADVVHTAPQTGRSHLVLDGDIRVRNGFATRRLQVRMDPLQVALVRSFNPGLELGGTLTGRATLSGALASGFDVDADVVHNDARTGRSRIIAVGDVLLANGFAARNLRLRFDPLQVALVRSFNPGLPLDGTITGRATVNGSPRGRLSATSLDIAHNGSTGLSQLAGDARLTFGCSLCAVDVNLRARPLSLATAGRFMPAAGLRGSVSGTVTARGNASNITFATNLAVADGGGMIDANGTLGMGRVVAYDAKSRLVALNPAAVTTRVPSAILTGTIDARGQGTDPATARAFVNAALVDSRLPGAPALDTTRVVARIDAGLATIERAHVRLSSAAVDASGTFGLIASRTGELRYQLRLDTLAHFAQQIPRDTGLVIARPVLQARRIAQARADSLRTAQATDVERAATGSPPAPSLSVDTVPPVRRDSVSGSVLAEGVLAGNVKRFDARGTAELKDVVLHGNSVENGHVAYTVTNAPSAQMSLLLDADLDGVRTAGFEFDSVTAKIEHRGGVREGTGTVDMALFADPARDYRLRSDYVVELDRKELRLDQVVMRFDTTRWTSTQPAVVRWGASSLELGDLELRNDRGGRIFADGRLPGEGSGDLRLTIDSLQIGDIAGLLQDTLETRGILTLDGRFEGTTRAPRISGVIAVDSLSRAGKSLPALRSTFEYADQQLRANAEMLGATRPLLTAEARIPINLAITGVTGPRMLDGPVSVDVRADSLPLEALPNFTTAVKDVQGRVNGDFAVRGTFRDPDVTGTMNLTLASMKVVYPGLTLEEGQGTLHMQGDTVYVDSLVAKSVGGPIRLAGTVNLETLTRPVFDLTAVADNAILLDNDRGRLRANADLIIEGPYDTLAVNGTIDVDHGVIYVPEPENIRRATNLDDPALASTLDTLGATPEVLGWNPMIRNLRMNVAVRFARDTWVRNANMNVEIYSPPDAAALVMTMTQGLSTLTLEGIINADRGEYTLAGRQFELTTGSVTFLGDPDPDPMLQLSAQHEVPQRGREALIILINIGGFLSQPRITLSSNAPTPIPESDLISYLAFGRSTSSLVALDGSGVTGDAAGGLGALAQQQLAGLGLGALTESLVKGLEDQARKARLDVFRVRPATLPSELSFNNYFQNVLRGTEIEAGSYVTPRLFLAADGRASGTWPGIRAEYETPTGFSWITTWQPRYLPSQPSLVERDATQTRVFGAFMYWTKRF